MPTDGLATLQRPTGRRKAGDDMGETKGPRCCAVGCVREGTVHLVAGKVTGRVMEDGQYTGGSFCSWQHLADWAVTASDGECGVPRSAPESAHA